ncbi:hypothetical protein OIO90_000407 [Microbotryomycetes sp. JL221]|nr:hypothetical protein OIO90_000407 [Microbotryomycetes sp. JL221]
MDGPSSPPLTAPLSVVDAQDDIMRQQIVLDDNETCIMSTTVLKMDVLEEETTQQVRAMDDNVVKQYGLQQTAGQHDARDSVESAFTMSASTVEQLSVIAPPDENTNAVVNLLSPPQRVTTSVTNPGLKRLSLPISSTAPPQVIKRLSLIPLPSSTKLLHPIELATTPVSETNGAGMDLMTADSTIRPRRNSTSIAQDQGTLLTTSAAAQIHQLKQRNTVLENKLSQLQQTQSADLFKALQRIQSLELVLKEFDQTKLDKEGWEAESQKLSNELDQATSRLTQHELSIRTSQQLLTKERIKRKKFNDLCLKLKAELHNRRWKEKWELGLLDVVDRDRDQKEIQLEAKVTCLTMELGLANLDKEELQESLDVQTQRLQELAAVRDRMIESNKNSDSLIAALKKELVTVRSKATKDVNAVEQRLTVVQQELDRANERVIELETDDSQEQVVQSLRDQINSLQNQVKKLESSKEKKQSDSAKEVAEATKLVDKERSRREKVEEEVKTLKAELDEVKKAPAIAVTASAHRRHQVTEVAETEVDEVVETTVPAIKPAKADAAKKKKPLKTIASSSPPPSPPMSEPLPVSDVEFGQSEEEEEPVPAFVESKKKDTKTTSIKAVKRPAFHVDTDSSDDENKQDAAPVNKKKRKVDTSVVNKKTKMTGREVLEDKTVSKLNSTVDRPASLAATTKAGPQGSVKVSAFAMLGSKLNKDKLGKTGAGDEAQTKPKKRILGGISGKRTLFGGSSIENQDINGLGIPTNLSPIKGPSRPMGGNLLGVGKPKGYLF